MCGWGLIHGKHAQPLAPDRVKEWDDAVNEYFAIEERRSSLIGEAPKSGIPQSQRLLASPFKCKDLAQVGECLNAIALLGAPTAGGASARSTFCAIQIELFPFRYPITSETEYCDSEDSISL